VVSQELAGQEQRLLTAMKLEPELSDDLHAKRRTSSSG
jgi:hypothetical protein